MVSKQAVSSFSLPGNGISLNPSLVRILLASVLCHQSISLLGMVALSLGHILFYHARNGSFMLKMWMNIK